VRWETPQARGLAIAAAAVFLMACAARLAMFSRHLRPVQYMIAGTLVTGIGLLAVFLWLGHRRHAVLTRLQAVRSQKHAQGETE